MRRLALKLGVDAAVFVTLLRWGWNVGAGLLTIVIIAQFLSAELQGYYYTFNSLIALQIFAELGLNFAVVQFASHEMAQMSWSQDGTVSGNPGAKRRLQSLVQFSFSWFGIAALLMIGILLPTGLFFFGAFSSHETVGPNVTIAWVILVVFTAANLFVSAAVAILEGCGKVANVAVLRLFQAISTMAIAWCILGFGGGLYALALSSVTMAVVGGVWLWVNYRAFFNDIASNISVLPGLSWRKEIWPFQWRIAVSFMNGYLIAQLFTPFVFKTHGAVAAGQIGMSLQVISALNGAAMAWIVTKAPAFGQLIATKQRRQLDIIFFRSLVQSSIFLLVAIISVWSAMYYLNQTASMYADRLLPVPLFSLLCLVCIANHIVFAEAAYLRAHKEDPMMVISLLAGLATAILVIVLVPSLGVAGAVYSYAATTLSIGLLGSTYIFYSKRKHWMLNDNDSVYNSKI